MYCICYHLLTLLFLDPENIPRFALSYSLTIGSIVRQPKIYGVTTQGVDLAKCQGHYLLIIIIIIIIIILIIIINKLLMPCV